MKKSMHSRVIFYFISAILLFFFFSCRTQKQSDSSKSEVKDAALLQEGFVKAEIRSYDVDGCGFLIFLEDEKKLNPLNLGDEYKKEGLKVWIRYTIKKGVMTTCMSGEVVNILELQLR
jgi:hypothetical protein